MDNVEWASAGYSIIYSTLFIKSLNRSLGYRI
jgi:hypothetical protein